MEIMDIRVDTDQPYVDLYTRLSTIGIQHPAN